MGRYPIGVTLLIYFSLCLAEIVIGAWVVFAYFTWPEAAPLMFAAFISSGIVLAYIAWRKYLS